MVFNNYNFGTKEYDKQNIEKRQVRVDLMKHGIAKIFSEADKYSDEMLHEIVYVMNEEFNKLESAIESYEEKYGEDNDESQQ